MGRIIIWHLIALLMIFIPAVTVSAQDVCLQLDGAVIIAQDGSNTFLGRIASPFNGESIFNQFGTYGNEFSGRSIWNQFSQFGNPFSGYSPFNQFSSSPPMIIKNRRIIGYLSTNKAIAGSISPTLLKALCAE
jgi:hypothetical protein